MKNNFGENWTDKCFDGKSVGERALTPSRIYTRAIVDMTGGFDGEEKVKINLIFLHNAHFPPSQISSSRRTNNPTQIQFAANRQM